MIGIPSGWDIIGAAFGKDLRAWQMSILQRALHKLKGWEEDQSFDWSVEE
jgi:hypothetical protein